MFKGLHCVLGVLCVLLPRTLPAKNLRSAPHFFSAVTPLLTAHRLTRPVCNGPLWAASFRLRASAKGHAVVLVVVQAAIGHAWGSSWGRGRHGPFTVMSGVGWMGLVVMCGLRV